MPTPTRRALRCRAALALLATPMLALALSACSTSSPTDEPGTSSDSAGSGGGDLSDTELSAARDAYDLKLAECIRGKGVNVKDPKPGEGIQESSPQVQAASSSCIGELGEPPVRALSKNDVAEIEEQYLKEAACLRALGYDVADPPKGTALALENVDEADSVKCSEQS